MAIVPWLRVAGSWVRVGSGQAPPDPQPPSITTVAIAALTEGTPFDQTLAATGDTPITWDVSAGTLPDGLTLESNGRVHGTPAAAGAYSFTARATNSAGNDTRAFSGAVAAPGDGTTYTFDYADLAALAADGWDFLAKPAAGGTRDTYSASWIDYGPAGMSLQATAGDIYGAGNNSVNSLFHDLPAEWTAVEVDLDWNPSDNWHLAYLAAYQDDDNFVGVTRGYSNGQNMALISETAATPNEIGVTTQAATTMRLRLERAANIYTGKVSVDGGGTWTTIGTTTRTLTSPRVAVVIGGATAPTPVAIGTIRSVKVEV